MADESTLGLLLRAHARCSEQKHGEEYVHHNERSSSAYGLAVDRIEQAIAHVVVAEANVSYQNGKKAAKKEIYSTNPGEVPNGPKITD